MKRRYLQGNNKGLSLVELLVAVAILSIVVFPLLHTFVTSADTASKSRKIGDETLAAQNTAEAVAASSLDTLADLGEVKAYDSSHIPWTDTAKPAAEYVVKMRNVGDGKYDATVTLTAKNEQEVTLYTPIDAAFTQEEGDLDPDTMAKAEFKLQAAAITDASLDYDITRTINIEIEEATGGDYEYACSYNYECDISYTDADGNDVTEELSPVSYSYVFYNGTFHADKETALASLYFFFRPCYSTSVYDDTITITHHAEDGDCHPVSVFLAKQADGRHASYKLLAQLKGDKDDNTRVYCNVSNSIFRVFRSEGVWYEKKMGYFGKLVATEKQYRLYDMTVDIYDDAGNKVYTLNASKLG